MSKPPASRLSRASLLSGKFLTFNFENFCNFKITNIAASRTSSKTNATTPG